MLKELYLNAMRAFERRRSTALLHLPQLQALESRQAPAARNDRERVVTCKFPGIGSFDDYWAQGLVKVESGHGALLASTPVDIFSFPVSPVMATPVQQST